ncbi:hypothetical protein HDU93_004741 [Gonapodya sp. JEL0774]|nr:hypothetical protein HDU93_004741 [Gonapodya sp. JEL0774]
MTLLRPFLMIFDFDMSLIDDDCDNVFMRELVPDIVDELSRRAGEVWVDLVAESAKEAARRGFTEEQIVTALQKAPLHPSTAEAIRTATEAGGEVIICSDANTFFIETILKAENATSTSSRYGKILYVGDGRNDYCPISLLSERDIALVRRGKALERLVDGTHGGKVRAKVVKWGDGREILATVRREIGEWKAGGKVRG